MRRLIAKKLRGRAGESIGETLAALLISALALLMLAGAVSAATRVITQSTAKLDAYYQANNAVAAQSQDADGVLTLALTDAQAKRPVRLMTEDAVQVQADYYINDSLGNTPVIAYTLRGTGIVTGGGGS